MVDLDENKRELQELKKRFLGLEQVIGTEEKLEKELKELEGKTLESGFWSDNKTANSVLQDIKEVKSKYMRNGIYKKGIR